MITYRMLKELHELADGRNLIVSLYLNVDPDRNPENEFLDRARSMLEGALEQVRENPEWTEWQKKGAERDVEKILDYLEEQAPLWNKEGELRGVAIFASHTLGFWQFYPLPRAPRERAVIDLSPYIRPLTLLLDEYKRFYVVLIDPKKARLFEMFLGSIEEEEKFVDVVGRVKSPPLRLKRAVEEAVYEHYRKVAEVLYDRYREGRFDLLIVGGEEEAVEAFLYFLPFHLRQILAGTFVMNPNAPVSRVLDEARKIEIRYEKEEEKKFVQALKEELQKGDTRAAAGLSDTLRALMENRVATLIVAEGFETPGMRCPSCGYLGIKEETCPACGARMIRVPDVVDDIIEEAVEQGVRVEHVLEKSLLEDVGYIGALLRHT